ncbi:hypothetical protein [Alteribacter salitolerans]
MASSRRFYFCPECQS